MAVYPTGAIHRPSNNYVWDNASMAWVVETQPSGGSGGGAATIADGADVAEGSTTDAAVITDTTGTVSGKLRGLVKWAFERMPAALGQTTMTASLPVAIASNQSSIPVTGTFFQGTQPVSAVALPLPTGAATAALQTQVTPSLNTGVRDAGTQRVTIATNDVVPVTGTFFQTTQPVSNAGTFAVQVTSAPAPTALVNANPLLLTEAVATALSQDERGNLRVRNDLEVFVVSDLLLDIVAELRVLNMMFYSTQNCRDDMDRLRHDAQQIQRGFTIN